MDADDAGTEPTLAPIWQDALWRIDSAHMPPAERLRLVRRVLREGGVEVRQEVFRTYTRRQMDSRWGFENELENARELLRVHAVRALRGPGGPDDRYHQMAIDVLFTAARPADVSVLLRFARGPVQTTLALQTIQGLCAELGPRQQVEVLDWAEQVLREPGWDPSDLHYVAVILQECRSPRAIELLRRGAFELAPVDGAGDFAASLIQRDPGARPLGAVLLGELLRIEREGDPVRGRYLPALSYARRRLAEALEELDSPPRREPSAWRPAPERDPPPLRRVRDRRSTR